MPTLVPKVYIYIYMIAKYTIIRTCTLGPNVYVCILRIYIYNIYYMYVRIYTYVYIYVYTPPLRYLAPQG